MMTMTTLRANGARTGPEGACVVMATCKNCRGPLRSDNSTGYCTVYRDCGRLADMVRKGKEPTPRQTCQGCGGIVQVDNLYGYCTKTDACRAKARHLGKEHNKEPLKTCKGCGRDIRRHNKSGYCRKTPLCVMENTRYYNSTRKAWAKRNEYRDTHPEAQMWSSAKWRAEKKGIPFSITREDVRDAMADVCPVFGYEFKHGKNGIGPLPCSPSLDKIDNSKGYVPGNIQVLSQKANAMKGDATPQELLKFADWIYATFGAAKGGG